MRIGKQDQPFTSICTSDAESIRVRGQDLCRDLIGKIDFTSYFWLLVTGRMPSQIQRDMADAMLVALAEHGLVPSVVAARMTYAAAPEAFQGAVAAGLLGCGSVVLGSAEIGGRFLSEVTALARDDDISLPEAADRTIKSWRAAKQAIPGFGHPQHSAGDPRALLLLSMAEERGVSAEHIAALRAVESGLPGAIGKSLPININGAIPAILLDIGFPLASLKAIGLLARTAGLIGHLTEEAESPIGFIMSGAAARSIDFIEANEVA